MDLPVGFLDNDWESPDLDRYVDVFEQVDPSVAVVGDVYSDLEAYELDQRLEVLDERFPRKRLVAVPKYRDAFDSLDPEYTTLGVPAGFSELDPFDVAPLETWRESEFDLHILGSSPERQLDWIEKLTGPTVTGLEPAEVVGVDWNGYLSVAFKGEYWTRDGWMRADHLSVRETVRNSLQEIRQFWQDESLWPETEYRNLYGPAVVEPDRDVFMDCGGDPILTREELENSYISEYDRVGRVAFSSELEKKFTEWREGWI